MSDFRQMSQSRVNGFPIHLTSLIIDHLQVLTCWLYAVICIYCLLHVSHRPDAEM